MNPRNFLCAVSVCTVSAILALALAGCSAGGAGNAGHHRVTDIDKAAPPAAAAIETETQLDEATAARLKQAVRPASADAAEHLLASAGPTAGYRTDASGTVQTNVMLNRDDTDMEPGMYSLYAYCIGDGSLSIEFSVGHATETQTLQCDADLASVVSRINLQQAVHGNSIRLEPEDGAETAIAYRLEYERG